MPAKLFNLLAITSLAIIGSSFGTTPVNALGHSNNLAHRHHARAANAIAQTNTNAAPEARRKRSIGKRCVKRTAPTASAPTAGPTDAAANAAGAPTDAAATDNAAPTDNSAPTDTAATDNAAPTGAAANAAGDPNAGGNTATSAAAAASTATSGTTYTGPSGTGKKVAFAWGGSPDQIKNFITPDVGMYYDWTPNPDQTAKGLGLQVCPMFWGDRDTDTFQQTVVAGYANCVLGFNEPNESSQSNMDPTHAAQLWMQYIYPLKAQGYRLIGPATTSAPDGMTWYQTFINACGGMAASGIDAIALHYYDVTAQGFIDYVNLWHNTWGVNIWVTEYACQNFNGGAQCDDVPGFLSQTAAFLNGASFVEFYAYFGLMESLPDNVNPANLLMDTNGMPTALGTQFINGD